jgi:hypothetical protein
MDKLALTKSRYGDAINHFEDDDFIDRLNNRWTVRALLMCIFVVTVNFFWGKPITCWTPSMFT